MAVTALVATGAAMLLLAKAVLEQPLKRPAKQPREVDGGNDPKTGLSRGIVTFLLAGPIALAVSTLFALAARIALIATGASEADGNVAVLGLVPLVWPILAFCPVDVRAPQNPVSCDRCCCNRYAVAGRAGGRTSMSFAFAKDTVRKGLDAHSAIGLVCAARCSI